MQEKINLWLDDERPMPASFNKHCRTAEEAIEVLKTGNVEYVSLDNYLGSGYTMGFKVAEWIAEQAVAGTLSPIKRMRSHTDSPDFRNIINSHFRTAMKAWGQM